MSLPAAAALDPNRCQQQFNSILVPPPKHRQLRSVNMSLVYSKALRVQSADSYSGNVVNLVAVDTSRVIQGLGWLHRAWELPLQMVVSLIILYQVRVTHGQKGWWFGGGGGWRVLIVHNAQGGVYRRTLASHSILSRLSLLITAVLWGCRVCIVGGHRLDLSNQLDHHKEGGGLLPRCHECQGRYWRPN